MVREAFLLLIKCLICQVSIRFVYIRVGAFLREKKRKSSSLSASAEKTNRTSAHAVLLVDVRFVCEKQFLRSRRASRREREFARVWISPHTPLVCVSDIELKNMRDACPYLARDTLCYSLCIENRGLPISFLGGRGADLYAPIKLRFNHNMRHFAFPRVDSLIRDTKLIYTPALRGY